MKMRPQLSCVAIKQTLPGELLIFPEDGESRIGLRVIDKKRPPNPDDDPLTLVLGPTFSNEIVGPHIVAWIQDDVLSLGAGFTINLPSGPSKWTFEEPPQNIPSLVLAGNDLFVRANRSSTPRRVGFCYVNIADGTIHDVISRHRSYAISWEILAPIADVGSASLAYEVVLRF